jgi:hypothetical protein
MKRVLCIVPALAVMLAGGAVYAGAGPQGLGYQENTVVSLERRLDSLEAAQSRLRVQADVLARQIDILRGREILSAGEHRQLEKHLRQSQVLENQIQELESKRNAVWKEYRPALENLMLAYQKETELLVSRMERETDSKSRGGLLENVNTILKKKRARETALYENAAPPPPGRDIAAKPWDSPRELEIKGALLLDWEEALRREIGVVDGHIRSLQREEQVRRKAEELALGMRMFNPSEELMGREVRIGEPDPGDYKSTDLLNRNPEGAVPASARDGLSADESDKNADSDTPSWRSLSDLRDQIRGLQQLKSRLALRADTLQHRARYCTDLLDERRKQQ